MKGKMRCLRSSVLFGSGFSFCCGLGRIRSSANEAASPDSACLHQERGRIRPDAMGDAESDSAQRRGLLCTLRLLQLCLTRPGPQCLIMRPVPAGKRWIVQSATGGLANGNDRTNNIELGNNRSGVIFDGMKWTFGGPFFPGTSFSSAIFSTTLYAIFGPGETPTVRVTATPSLSGYSVIVFTGYLIDEN